MKLKLDNLAKQIGLGYSITLAIFIIALIFTLLRINQIEQRTLYINDYLNPITKMGGNVLNGVYHSSSELSKWIIIGNESGGDKFKVSRHDIWKKHIEPSINQLKVLLVDKNKPLLLKNIKLIEQELIKLKRHQEQVEDIANKPENTKATEVLLHDAVPLAESLVKEISVIIDLEKNISEKLNRKKILGVMADVRGTIGFSLADIRAYILSGDKKFKYDFEEQWRKNTGKYYELTSLSKFLTAKQKIAFQKFKDARRGFNKLPDKMFSFREANDWNTAYFYMRTVVSPLSASISNGLNEFVRDVDLLTRRIHLENDQEIVGLRFFLLSLLIFGGIFSLIICIKSINQVKSPINELEEIVIGMTKGEFNPHFEYDYVKEISGLAKAINSLMEFLLSKNLELTKEKDRLEDVDWVKTKLKKIMDKVSGQKDFSEFSNSFLSVLLTNIDCIVGKFYIIDPNLPDEYLLLSASYGVETIEGDFIEFGEGLAGQCALEGDIRYISELPKGFLIIQSTIGSVDISHIALVPILVESQVIGLLELGGLKEFTEITQELLSQVSFNIGGILKSNLARLKVEEMAQFLKAQDFTLNEHSLVSITDVNGSITYANEKFCSISGYKLEELVGENHRLVNSGYHSKEFFDELWTTILSGNPWKGEVCNKAKNGNTYWVAATIMGYKDVNGAITQFVAIRTDITEFKLNQEKLSKAVEKSKVYADAKGNFLANMSHEIRTPMNGVLGMLSLLEDTKLDHEQIDMIGTLKGCGNDLLVIINDILDFSKIEAGKLILEKYPFNVNNTIHDLIKLLEITAKKKGVSLFSVIPKDLPENFLGDVTRLRQVLTNLVNNAIKFTENGSVTIELTYKFDDGLYRIKFSVIDTGIGISPAHQTKLFKSFTQVDSSISRRYGGTGLGLAISYRIAEAMEGFMWMESKVGEGSTFYVEIPLEESKTSLSGTEDKENATHVLNEHLTLLIVEDNIVNQKILSMMLKKLGYECDIAADGQKCLDLMEGHQYDLIFMDMQMPVMDGITATENIIKKYGDNRPRIVATTANVLEEDIQKCRQAGMDDFIPKPIKKEYIIKQLGIMTKLIAETKKAS